MQPYELALLTPEPEPDYKEQDAAYMEYALIMQNPNTRVPHAQSDRGGTGYDYERARRLLALQATGEARPRQPPTCEVREVDNEARERHDRSRETYYRQVFESRKRDFGHIESDRKDVQIAIPALKDREIAPNSRIIHDERYRRFFLPTVEYASPVETYDNRVRQIPTHNHEKIVELDRPMIFADETREYNARKWKEAARRVAANSSRELGIRTGDPNRQPMADGRPEREVTPTAFRPRPKDNWKYGKLDHSSLVEYDQPVIAAEREEDVEVYKPRHRARAVVGFVGGPGIEAKRYNAIVHVPRGPQRVWKRDGRQREDDVAYEEVARVIRPIPHARKPFDKRSEAEQRTEVDIIADLPSDPCENMNEIEVAILAREREPFLLDPAVADHGRRSNRLDAARDYSVFADYEEVPNIARRFEEAGRRTRLLQLKPVPQYDDVVERVDDYEERDYRRPRGIDQQTREVLAGKAVRRLKEYNKQEWDKTKIAERFSSDRLAMKPPAPVEYKSNRLRNDARAVALYEPAPFVDETVIYEPVVNRSALAPPPPKDPVGVLILRKLEEKKRHEYRQGYIDEYEERQAVAQRPPQRLTPVEYWQTRKVPPTPVIDTPIIKDDFGLALLRRRQADSERRSRR